MGANRDFRKIAEQLPPLVARDKNGEVRTNPIKVKGSKLLEDMPHLKDAEPKIEANLYYLVHKPLLVDHFFMLKKVNKLGGKEAVIEYIKKVSEENAKAFKTPEQE